MVSKLIFHARIENNKRARRLMIYLLGGDLRWNFKLKMLLLNKHRKCFRSILVDTAVNRENSIRLN